MSSAFSIIQSITSRIDSSVSRQMKKVARSAFISIPGWIPRHPYKEKIQRGYDSSMSPQDGMVLLGRLFGTTVPSGQLSYDAGHFLAQLRGLKYLCKLAPGKGPAFDLLGAGHGHGKYD